MKHSDVLHFGQKNIAVIYIIISARYFLEYA